MLCTQPGRKAESHGGGATPVERPMKLPMDLLQSNERSCRAPRKSAKIVCNVRAWNEKV